MDDKPQGEKGDKPDVTQFHIGFTGTPSNPGAMLVWFPVETYAEAGAEGLDAFYGKIKRVEVIGVAKIRELVAAKSKAGLLAPGKPRLEVVQ